MMMHFSWLETTLLRNKKWLIMHTLNRNHNPPFLTRLQLNPNSGRKIRQIGRKKRHFTSSLGRTRQRNKSKSEIEE